MSESVLDRIREQGRVLDGPNLKLPAYAELVRLRWRVRPGELPVAIYGNETAGFSSSPLDTVRTLKLCRRSLNYDMTCTYFAVPAALIVG